MIEEKISESVMQHVRSGKKIAAIKQLREEQGLGLKEAKEIIDREVAEYRRANPQAPHIPQSSPWPKVFVIALIALGVYWYLSRGG